MSQQNFLSPYVSKMSSTLPVGSHKQDQTPIHRWFEDQFLIASVGVTSVATLTKKLDMLYKKNSFHWETISEGFQPFPITPGQ